MNEVEALIALEGLEAHAERIVAAVRAGYELQLDPDADASAPGVDKIGGSPDLAPGEKWPCSPRGVRLAFLGQVDLTKLAPIPAPWAGRDPWPRGGIMRVFFDAMQEWWEPGAAHVLVAPSDSAWSRMLPPAANLPADLPGREEVEAQGELPELAVRPVPILTLPEALTGVLDHPAVSRPERDAPLREAYGRLGSRIRNKNFTPGDVEWPWAMTQLFGAATAIQREPEEIGSSAGEDDREATFGFQADPALGPKEAWTLLLSVDGTLDISYPLFDEGALYVMAPRADLEKGQLDRIIFDVQTG